MQPYFLPYIGYFQLINAVDQFVIYDNIQYTKKGWINRNRFLRNGADYLFTISLQKDSDFLNICDRKIDNNFAKVKLLNKLRHAYGKAPFFGATYPIIEEIIQNEDDNLFTYILNSVISICRFLKIDTTIITSSTISIDHSLTGQKKVVALCQKLEADVYINAIGGQELYNKESFRKIGCDLQFIKSDQISYNQFSQAFVPNLSILDLMMFNKEEDIRNMLNQYSIIQ